MDIIPWQSHYSVGISRMDEQHQNLIHTMNELYDHIQTKKGNLIIQKTLDEMTSYIQVHFSDEENLMKTHNYPEYEHHKELHQYFRKRLEGMYDKHKSGDPDLPFEIFKFLKNWFLHHICETDQKYTAFFNEMGIK